MTRKVKLRTLLIGGLFTLFFIFMMGRLYWVQVVKAKEYTTKAEDSWNTDRVIPPQRGSIVDRNGNALAEDVAAYTVVLDPKTIKDSNLESDIAHNLAQALTADGGNSSELESKIRG